MHLVWHPGNSEMSTALLSVRVGSAYKVNSHSLGPVRLGSARLGLQCEWCLSSSATSLNDVIIYERVYALRNRVFYLIAPNGWAIASQHFEGPYRLVFPSVTGTFLRYVCKKAPDHATQERRIQVPQIFTRCKPRRTLCVFVRFLVWVVPCLYANHLQSAVALRCSLRERQLLLVRALLMWSSPLRFCLACGGLSCVTSPCFLDNGGLVRDWTTLT